MLASPCTDRLVSQPPYLQEAEQPRQIKGLHILDAYSPGIGNTVLSFPVLQNSHKAAPGEMVKQAQFIQDFFCLFFHQH